ncbi:MAG: hypothetical protein M3037_08175 [Gemmatimonadota bacterium]|nr:hypothetical protein [Gemmatimonadota bacterium]
MLSLLRSWSNAPLIALVICAAVAIAWNNYEYFRVLRALGRGPFTLIGFGYGYYLRRPWLFLAGWDRTIRATTARQRDPVAEAARRRFARRQGWIIVVFFVIGFVLMEVLPM